MCGICGFIDLDNKKSDHNILRAMNNAIIHRGVDDEGCVLIDQKSGRYVCTSGENSPSEIKNIYPDLRKANYNFNANIGLAHNRFSIIDLSIAGHQPFFSSDKTSCVIFNGEMYNYIEVRDELIAKGCKFKTNSDTEVLIEAYRMWGTDCFSKFNGFWAIVIYDFTKKQLIFSRDRIGKKSLYWSKKGSKIYFASEIKALLEVPDIKKNINPNKESIYTWLAYYKSDINDSTFFEDIYSFPAASWAVVDNKYPGNCNKYWELPKSRLTEKEISVPEACKKIRETLLDSTRIRLRADVPIALGLSGGMDSSALVALASQISTKRITTYTVRYKNSKWNEEPYARSIAKKFNVNYKIIDSPFENFWPQILNFTNLIEEPYYSPNLHTNQVIWTLMRSEGVKVTINGAGGDELFAGYPIYFRNAQYDNIKKMRFGQFFSNMLNWTQQPNFFRKIIESVGSPLLVSPFVTSSLKGLIGRNTRYNINIKPTNMEFPHKKLSDLLYSDMTIAKMSYWMRSGDRSYMGIPFEFRAPFLDYRLVEFAFSLPTIYLLKDGWHKWILRKALENDLPKDVLWRKIKMGFPFPYKRFSEENKKIINMILEGAKNPYLNITKSKKYRRSWPAISFILWYELFFNKNIELFNKIVAESNRKNNGLDYGYTPEYLKNNFN